MIASSLRQPGGDTASYFILKAARSECGKHADCLRSYFYAAVEAFEQHGKYQAAIPLAEQLVALAQLGGDLKAEASAWENLIRLFNFAEDTRKLIAAREKLIKLYEEMGDMEGVITNKAIIQEGRAWDLKMPGEAITEIEALLDQAHNLNLTNTANKIRIRLKYLYEEFGHYEKLAGIVSALEKIPFSDPLQPAEASYAFHAASGRADLLVREKQFDRAASLYQKALEISRQRFRKQHDAWSEIYTLHRLAKLETKRQHFTHAHTYADEALEKAKKLKMIDHLEVNHTVRAELAEAEGRYADALHHTKKFYEYRDRVDSLSPGFDMKKYFLELEAEQLKLEKERQTLALQLKTSQLNYSIIVVALALILAVGLLFGLYKQRKSKRALAAQNALIQQQAEQLKQLDSAKSRFFANISHELRTPLTLMLGPVKSLLKGNHPPKKQEQLLNMALQNGEQLGRLVNEILDLRKLEMGKMKLQEEPTELLSFFNQYTAQFESLAANQRIDFSYETSIEAGVSAGIDQEKCRQVLQNLLSNAFKFTPAGGSIAAKLSLEDKLLTLEVTDTGAGIHPDDLPHVFDRFFQTSRLGKTAEGGTGIGLALCKEYMQLFGGKMEVESQLGKGSVFRAIFPVTLSESTEVAAVILEIANVYQPLAKPENGPSDKSADGTLPTILVVEDNPDLQQYIQFILAEKYNVVTAENGQAAMDMLAPHPIPQFHSSPIPDLILSDLMMPVMDGYQLLEKLKSKDATRQIPVIMLTARAEARDKLRALRIGVDDYLTKPFDEEELLVRIENLLANRSQREQAGQREDSLAVATALSKPDEAWLEEFEAYVKSNLANDALTISFLAQEFAMSDSTLFRQVTRLTGLSPKQYLQEVRLDVARQLLENRDHRTVSLVAAKVGFSNARTFSRCFKERFGKLPGEYLND